MSIGSVPFFWGGVPGVSLFCPRTCVSLPRFPFCIHPVFNMDVFASCVFSFSPDSSSRCCCFIALSLRCISFSHAVLSLFTSFTCMSHGVTQFCDCLGLFVPFHLTCHTRFPDGIHHSVLYICVVCLIQVHRLHLSHSPQPQLLLLNLLS